jgi:hypothetical protein
MVAVVVLTLRETEPMVALVAVLVRQTPGM